MHASLRAENSKSGARNTNPVQISYFVCRFFPRRRAADSRKALPYPRRVVRGPVLFTALRPGRCTAPSRSAPSLAANVCTGTGSSPFCMASHSSPSRRGSMSRSVSAHCRSAMCRPLRPAAVGIRRQRVGLPDLLPVPPRARRSRRTPGRAASAERPCSGSTRPRAPRST